MVSTNAKVCPTGNDGHYADLEWFLGICKLNVESHDRVCCDQFTDLSL